MKHNKSQNSFRRRSSADGGHEPSQEEPVVDDFFDTSPSVHTNNNNHSSSSQYHPSSERFIFDGDEEDAFISQQSPTSPYISYDHFPHHNNNSTLNTTTEPLLPQVDPDNHSEGTNEEQFYRLRLPFARRHGHRGQTGEQTRPVLSGLNILNLVTFVVVLVIAILWGSDVVETAMHQHHHRWLPSPWTVTNQKGYETLLTPDLWAGEYIWIPVMVFEGMFSLVQLLPAVRTRPEVISGVGYFWFYIGILQGLTTIFFCLKWIIPAWCTLAANLSCLILLQFQVRQTNLLDAVTKWEYWVFRFPFDLQLGWLLPLFASRGSMIFRRYGAHDIGMQLAADIVCMALLLPCAGACLTRGQGPPDWVIPLLIMWAYIGVGCRLLYTPHALIDLYGEDIVAAVRGAAFSFAGAVGLMVVPNTVVWVAREFLTIQVVQLSEEEEVEEEVEGLVLSGRTQDGMDTSDF